MKKYCLIVPVILAFVLRSCTADKLEQQVSSLEGRIAALEGVYGEINGNATAKEANGGNDTISAVTAMGYDAYYVALEAIKKAGSGDKAAIMKALPDVTYDGVSGSIAFDSQGDAIRDTAYIKTANTTDGTWALETVQKGSSTAETEPST